jgi:polyhydroxybutyrate depolymerase
VRAPRSKPGRRLNARLAALLLLGWSVARPSRAYAQDAARVSSLTLASAGLTRTALQAAPSSGVPRAIVLLLHGHGGSARQLLGLDGANAAPYRLWLPLAERERLLLLVPNGAVGSDARAGWNDCRADAATNPGTDDVAFLMALVAQARATHRAPDAPLLVMGTSNGGHMALRLAIERPEQVRAAVSLVAGMPVASRCPAPSRSVPLLMINGTRDRLMPYAGGAIGGGREARGRVLSVDSSLALWRALLPSTAPVDSVALPARVPRDATRGTRISYGSRTAPPLVLVRLDGAGHAEPSARERYRRIATMVLGAQSSAVETVDEAWAFLRAHLMTPR